MFDKDIDLDYVERTVLGRGMNFSGNADEVQVKKEFFVIAVKAAIQVLKECSHQSDI